jgi:tetratricopeptide (TPR) repeat protein
VLAALREATAARPLVAVIDDFHAADASSLRLLETIGGDLHRLGALFVLTLRDTEPAAHVGGVLGELLRHRGVEQIVVPGLDTADVGRLAERFAGEDVTDEFATALYDRTSGNPFYVGELLRLLRSERRSTRLRADDVSALDVPSGVRDVIDRRLTRLPTDTRSLLSIAATAGRALDLDLLERSAGIDTDQLMLALEPAIAAGLLVEQAGPWGYEFRHALIQESIYTGIGSLDRARLHARIAAALEELADPSSHESLGALAHHHLAAGPFGDPAKAADFSRRAAHWAMRQSASVDAVRHLREALDAVSLGRGTEATRADVLVELGAALRAAGDIESAHAALYEAIDVADRLGDEDRLLRAAVAFGSVSLWGARAWGEPDFGLIGILEEQLRRYDGDDVMRVRLLATLSSELYHSQRQDEAWTCAMDALTIARRLGDPESYGIAVAASLTASQGPDHSAEWRAIVEEVLSGVGPTTTPALEAVVRLNRLTALLRSGEIVAFDTEFSRVRDLVTKLRSRELEAQLLVAEASREIVLGRVAEGVEVFERGYALLVELSDKWAQPSLLVCQVCVYLASGQLGVHVEELVAHVDHPSHPSLPHVAAPAAALGYVQLGEFDRARALVDRTFAAPGRVWTWMLPMALWAQVAAEIGEPDPQWLYDQLLPLAGELALAGIGADAGGAVESLLAGLASRLGRDQDAVTHARRGLALERHAGARVWVERTMRLLAKLEQSSSREPHDTAGT